MNVTDRYEIIARLYERRTGHLAPGKDRAAAAGPETDQDHRDNLAVFSHYAFDISDLAEDAIAEIDRLRSEVSLLSLLTSPQE